MDWNSGQWTVDSGQWTVDSGQWTVNSGQWTVESKQWIMNCYRQFWKFCYFWRFVMCIFLFGCIVFVRSVTIGRFATNWAFGPHSVSMGGEKK